MLKYMSTLMEGDTALSRADTLMMVLATEEAFCPMQMDSATTL